MTRVMRLGYTSKEKEKKIAISNSQSTRITRDKIKKNRQEKNKIEKNKDQI